MMELTRDTTASPEEVWAVLCNGFLFASWVVGASRIRDVEGDWPSAGAKIHHSVGAWPALLNDETEVEASETNRLLRLKAKTRPIGEALVELELQAASPGTVITMREDVISGPFSMLPARLRTAMLLPRNRESLRRLIFLAEGGAS